MERIRYNESRLEWQSFIFTRSCFWYFFIHYESYHFNRNVSRDTLIFVWKNCHGICKSRPSDWEGGLFLLQKHNFRTSKDYLNYMYADTQGWVAKSTNQLYFDEHFYQARIVSEQPSVDNQKNTYISLNTFFKKKRQVVCLKRLNACYVDIDCYKMGIRKETALYMLEQDYFKQRIPDPTLVVDSGRGLYLIWKLKNEDRNALPRWKKVQEYLIETCKEFGADSACADAARILRIPFTINERNEEQVKILKFYDYTYSLYEIIKEYDIPYTPYRKKEKKRTTEKMRRCALRIAKTRQIEAPDLNDYEKTFAYIKTYYVKGKSWVTKWKNLPQVDSWTRGLLMDRCNDLERLFSMRKGEECKREIALFMYRLWQILITGDYQEALDKTLDFNHRLDKPFSDQYVKIRTRSAERILKRGKIYRYSNRRIVQDLEITDQEQQYLSILKDLGLSSSPIQEQKRKKKERNRKAYIIRLKRKGEIEKKEKIELRREALLSMQKKGYSVKEICQKLHISKTTYYRDMAVLAPEPSEYTNTDEQKMCQKTIRISKKSVQKVLRKFIQKVQRNSKIKKLNMEEVSFFKLLYYNCTPLGVLRAPICHRYMFDTS